MVATHLYLRGWWTSVFEAKPDLYSVFRGRQGPYLKKKKPKSIKVSQKCSQFT